MTVLGVSDSIMFIVEDSWALSLQICYLLFEKPLIAVHSDSDAGMVSSSVFTPKSCIDERCWNVECLAILELE